VSFLAPIWLVLTAAIVVPLALHLMRRHIDTRIEFPAVRYLARAEKENIRSLKLRNLLLMLLRTLAVLLLALAAARPIGWLIGAGHVPTALAIVLDNSLSSGAIIDGAPLLNRLKDAARSVVTGATSSDRVWLVTIDGVVTGGTIATVREAVDRTQVFGGRGDLTAASARAAGLVLASGLPEREVMIVSDGQATEWKENIAVGDARVVTYVPRTTAPPNRAMAAAEPRPPRWTPRGLLVLRAAGADSVTYRVSLGDRTLARGSLRGNDDVTLRVEPPERGWVAGSAELAPDELRGDDVRHFAVWIGAAPAVRVDPSAGPFARNAIEALVQSERASVGSGIDLASAEAATRLPALLLAPSDPVRLGAANRMLERLGVPWRFSDPQRDETVARGSGFDDVSIKLRYPLHAQGSTPADTLARASGEPWIVAGDKYVLIGSPLDPNATSLPVRAQFLPWLADVMAQRLSADNSALVEAAPGGHVRLPAGVTALERDDGSPVAATADMPAPSRPGVYFLRRGADRAGALVVNPELEESELARLEPRDLTSRLRASDRTVTSDAGQFRRAAFTGGARRPLQTTLIIVALACLLAEMLIVRRPMRQVGRRAA
jgi:aerotolerance regulator-like protein